MPTHNTRIKHLTTLSMTLVCVLAMTACKSTQTATSYTPMPWEDPTYDNTLPATFPESRPTEGPGAWTAWTRHHENRIKWTTEQPVDMLMIGDSIVFGWSRIGKPVWDEFYGQRNAVNIGSSGDRTSHMLWHITNGGLAGMKDHNPKLVVIMIGTNNRGDPEQHGTDTAYGILAILKEVHAQLPNSKILLLAIFPRGDKPDDKGRLRNDEINKIIQTYADNKTVYWLDIGHVFLDDQGTLKRDLMPDALHPNIPGYRAWGEAMEPMIVKLMGE
ncbi:MAG: acetylglucosamine-6-sulfatase [Phycisphaera sp.]|nr:acetylglucosamine-6-sulfatase [Phycisphaera sp.]